MHAKGFTLIELLIVIAIIAILALIAVPNFLEAQTRANVSRARADLLALSTALESYMSDYGAYPPNDGTYSATLQEMTTPIAYIARADMIDPFAVGIQPSGLGEGPYSPIISPLYTYMQIVTLPEATFWSDQGRTPPREAIDHFAYNRGAFIKYGYWRLASKGPDRVPFDLDLPAPLRGPSSDILYDPTNGTMSFGNILRTQRHPEGYIFLPN